MLRQKKGPVTCSAVEGNRLDQTKHSSNRLIKTDHHNNNRAYVRSAYTCPQNLIWKVWLAGARTELAVNNVKTARQLLKRALSSAPRKMRYLFILTLLLNYNSIWVRAWNRMETICTDSFHQKGHCFTGVLKVRGVCWQFRQSSLYPRQSQERDNSRVEGTPAPLFLKPNCIINTIVSQHNTYNAGVSRVCIGRD